jgi:glycosyltransferase involved in cell wall biosynthesis
LQSNAPPRGVYEAGIYGIPSILAMEDKVEDVVKNNYNGFLIDEESPDQLVDAILKYINNPSLRKEHGENARKRFVENHDPKKVAQKVYDIYKTILSEKSIKNNK